MAGYGKYPPYIKLSTTAPLLSIARGITVGNMLPFKMTHIHSLVSHYSCLVSLTDNLAEPVISMQASHTFCYAEVMKRSPIHWHLPQLLCLQLCHTYFIPFQSSYHSVHMNTVSATVTFTSSKNFWLAEICQTGIEERGKVKIFPTT